MQSLPRSTDGNFNLPRALRIAEQVNWATVFTAAAKKCVLDPEILELRLSSFPLELLDLLAVPNVDVVNEMKQGYTHMVVTLTGVTS